MSEDAGWSLTNVKATGTCVAPDGECFGIGMLSFSCAAGTCWTTTADRCSFAALGADPYRQSVYVDGGVALKLGASALIGPIGRAPGGTLACVNNYDGESYMPAACP
jgi:hypothetical protein